MQDKGNAEEQRFDQVISGRISLKQIQEVDPSLAIKIAVVRDCRIIVSQVLQLKEKQTELEFRLPFKSEGPQPMGVRVVMGPGDLSDERLRSVDVQDQRVPASAFKGGTANVDIELAPGVYEWWRRVCRVYTIRGRVVCRRFVWDPRLHRFVLCDAPVRGARVTAYDVDRFWWWCRRDAVGSVFTDVNGNFEITFHWCCWLWRPWLFNDWTIDPDLLRRIRELLERTPIHRPIPLPDPTPDFTLFGHLVQSIQIAQGLPTQAIGASAGIGSEPSSLFEQRSDNFVGIGQQLVRMLPDAPDLQALHIWPFWPALDCTPDIIFNVTQDCGNGDQTIHSETCSQARWNIPTNLNGVTLVANANACCGSFCCVDRPDSDCLVFQGVGCGSYPVTSIEQDPTNSLVGFAYPGSSDRPFGGRIRILGVFGDASDEDYYKVQYRRVSPSPTVWADLPANQVGIFSRGHWLGVYPWYQWETVSLTPVGGQQVLKTKKRYRAEHPEVSTTVDPVNDDWLTVWLTSTSTNPTPGVVQETPNLPDGVYELRVIGYDYDAGTGSLVDQRVLPLCPGPGLPVDPSAESTMYLRLDNRVATTVPGSVHLDTTEPDCDFPDICAVVRNEGTSTEQCVGSCGIVRLKKGDTLTVHFKASDSDAHMEAYSLTAHWAESDVFNVLAAGSLAPDPDVLVGPTYAATFAGAQGTHRALLPPTDPEHERPNWLGGHFKVKVTVDDVVPSNPHKVFETCCAYLLRLRVWKRTTDGCTGVYYFHYNQCEFSFTVIREDLIGDPEFPSCVE